MTDDPFMAGLSLFSLVIALWEAIRLRHIRERLATVYSKFHTVSKILGLREIDFLGSKRTFQMFSTMQMLDRMEARLDKELDKQRGSQPAPVPK